MRARPDRALHGDELGRSREEQWLMRNSQGRGLPRGPGLRLFPGTEASSDFSKRGYFTILFMILTEQLDLIETLKEVHGPSKRRASPGSAHRVSWISTQAKAHSKCMLGPRKDDRKEGSTGTWWIVEQKKNKGGKRNPWRAKQIAGWLFAILSVLMEEDFTFVFSLVVRRRQTVHILME